MPNLYPDFADARAFSCTDSREIYECINVTLPEIGNNNVTAREGFHAS